METVETFFKTFFMIVLMEIGSSDMMYLTAVSAHSKMPWICFAGALLGIITCFILAILFSGLIQKIPVSLNLISGFMLITTGIIFLWKS